MQWTIKVVWTLTLLIFDIKQLSILFASTIYQFSDTPGPPIQCCVGAVVCVVQEIEKSTLLGGRRGGGGGKCFQDVRKSNSTSKCLNTLVTHFGLD